MIEKKDFLVVGAGIVGSVLTRFLRESGAEVILVDSKEEQSASKCSLGVWSDGWTKKIQPQVDESMEVYEGLGLQIKTQTVQDLDKNKSVDFAFLPFSELAVKPDYICKVTSIRDRGRTVNAVTRANRKIEFKADCTVLCCGVWIDELLIQNKYPSRDIDGYWGGVYEMSSDNIPSDNRTKIWSPYKQSLIHHLDNGVSRFSDGVKVKNPKKDDPRIQKGLERMYTHLCDLTGTEVDVDDINEVLEGLRPYLKKDQNFAIKHDAGLFSVTGGGKSTTVLAGHMVNSLLSIM